MGFFKDEELGALKIVNMILHVVGDDEFTAEKQRLVEHENFFIERIRDTDVAPVFEFYDASQTKFQLERIASRKDEFESGSQALSREFSRFHHGGSKNGAFFIFEIATNDPKVSIFSLIKYDYQEAVEQADSGDGNLLRLIMQAFVAEKRAIQKSALIRTINGKAESAVSARDRMKPAPEIGDYFAKFLHVTRDRSDAQLNQKVVEVLRETLTDARGVLPGKDVAKAFRHAQAILYDRQQIDEDAISEAIVAAAGNPVDEDILSKLQASVRRKIRSAKLDGLSFPADRTVLRRPPLRRVETTEGITITYPDDANNAILDRKAVAGGGEIITITTKKVTEDRVVRDSSRNPAG